VKDAHVPEIRTGTGDKRENKTKHQKGNLVWNPLLSLGMRVGKTRETNIEKRGKQIKDYKWSWETIDA
jgi:hypothetical protein